MPQGTSQKYRIENEGSDRGLTLVRGGQYGKPRRRRVRTPAEWRLDREMHAAFCAIHGADGTVPSDGIYEIRQYDQHPWRVLARRFREAQAAGVPKQQLIDVLRTFERWVDSDLYAAAGDRAA